MIQIDNRSRVPIYEQIINSIKQLTVAGILKPGEKLPSVRELSRQMTINPNTIQKAYLELERQGLIYVERGKGTFISENIQATNKEEKMNILYEKIKHILVECIYLGMEKKDLVEAIEKAYDEINSPARKKQKEGDK